ncbi:MAG TPA: hypothetical protein VLM85_15310 [Polyangiaceae bacterium]|nr:hypothetical protein [Polyangiaceae bacterium]
MNKPSVISFPAGARARRARTLDIAGRAIPLLQAALDAGNATLLRELFAVLGDEAAGADALARAESISIEDAQIVRLAAARGKP